MFFSRGDFYKFVVATVHWDVKLLFGTLMMPLKNQRHLILFLFNVLWQCGIYKMFIFLFLNILIQQNAINKNPKDFYLFIHTRKDLARYSQISYRRCWFLCSFSIFLFCNNALLAYIICFISQQTNSPFDHDEWLEN